jgi:hypothetical protein
MGEEELLGTGLIINEGKVQRKCGLLII